MQSANPSGPYDAAVQSQGSHKRHLIIGFGRLDTHAVRLIMNSRVAVVPVLP